MKPYFTFLALSSLLLLTTQANARPDPAEYWNKFVSNEPLPESIKGLPDHASFKERKVPEKENMFFFYRNSEEGKPNPSEYWNRVMKENHLTFYPNPDENRKDDPTEYWKQNIKGEPIPESIKGLLDVSSKERKVPQKENIPFYPSSEEGKGNPSNYWNKVMKGEPIPDSIKGLLDVNSKERKMPNKENILIFYADPDERRKEPAEYNWKQNMKGGEPIPAGSNQRPS